MLQRIGAIGPLRPVAPPVGGSSAAPQLGSLSEPSCQQWRGSLHSASGWRWRSAPARPASPDALMH
eukprot:11917274-Alexandrium_andersonii.AAC.1